MIGKVLIWAILVGVSAAVVNSLPDIARYLKIRQMQAGSRVARYSIDPSRSVMTMDARSSVHPIRGVARGLEGFIEAEVSDGQLDPAAPATMRFEFSVDQLKSGNSLYDAEMQRRVDSRRFPTIVGEAHDVQPGASDGTYQVRGDVTVHGVKRQVEGSVRVLLPDPTSLVVEGEREFDVRDFDMTPPSILGLKVHPQVLVRLQIVAERDGKTT